VAKYVKRYGSVKSDMIEAVRQYASDVRERKFPAAEHEYGIEQRELAKLRMALGE
jgi:3-methyl-2-oxobutanoate hydroxymethyltransferase